MLNYNFINNINIIVFTYKYRDIYKRPFHKDNAYQIVSESGQGRY